ncbi:MAG: cation:proton antiporter [Deferrisomatales bacterium]
MNPAAFLGTLALALAAAKVLGHAFDRVKLPPILGQILAGVVLASLGGFPAEVLRGEGFTALSDLGLVFLLLLTGTESSLKEIRRAGGVSALVAVGGVAVPFLLGLAAARSAGFGLPQALAAGALFTPTSIGVTAVTLLEAGRIRTRVGSTLVGAAILDDVLALCLLAVVLGTGSPQAVLGKATLYFVLTGLFAWKALPALYRQFRRIHLPEAPLTFVVIVTLGLAALAETVGLAGITGAFVAGLAVRERIGEEKLLDRVHAVAYGVFIPLFFVHLGASLDLGGLGGLGRLGPLFLAASFLGKFAGSAVGALLGRLRPLWALQIGVGMLPRMEVSLVVVAVAVRQGVFTGLLADLMTAVALLNMAASLLLTPVALRAAFAMEPAVKPHHPAPGPDFGRPGSSEPKRIP